MISENFTIHPGDCMDILLKMQLNSVDAVITDPPYGTNEEQKSKLTMQCGKLAEFAHEWDKTLPVEWVALSAGVLRSGGAFLAFTDAKEVTTLWNAVEKSGLRPLHTIYWKKTNPGLNPRKNFCSAVEVAVFARKPGKVLHWAGGGSTPNVWEGPSEREDRVHPTQKPIQLMRWLVRIMAPPGGHVLDPFCGSGTTGVAALSLGCRFTGIELDSAMCTHAARRCGEAVMDQALPLGDPPEQCTLLDEG